jgi:hypothetical protein
MPATAVRGWRAGCVRGATATAGFIQLVTVARASGVSFRDGCDPWRNVHDGFRVR